MTRLWTPLQIGRMRLQHRLAMSPMTRLRAQADGTPGALAARYYAQRASLGLLISEATQPSAQGQGYLNTPGIHSDAHVAGWRGVTDAVHAAGGHLFIQLMHVGRVSHPDNTPQGTQAVAPSAIAPGDEIYTASGAQTIPVPRAMTQQEIAATVQDFRRAAARAIEAGADGVELHGANGYLIQQFLSPNANQRQDGYGGPVERRMRFALEVVDAVAAEIGAERTAIRLSPGSRLCGIDEGPDYPHLYRSLVAALASRGLAYLHIAHNGNDALLRDLRTLWPGVLLVNRSGRPLEDVAQDIDAGLADMAPVGRWALANPDLVHRLRLGQPLNDEDPTTFYGGGAAGYVDYPELQSAERALLSA
ncbi:alkene reductase [Melaminivora suipulveris]|uniref:Alkene reductase n=1 Tax=Melaminivora suipulveris TaxID=2109913 RepID=A0A2R3QH42_9BURK|nr:alkene reductase [Melaminivora suipulveris]AVO51095.1 alkene reductase [Melaminivora suipulveris]